MSSYLLTTRRGLGARAEIATRFDLEGYVLTLELGDKPATLTPSEIGTVTYFDGMVTLELTPAEVETVKDSYFRVKCNKSVAPSPLLYWDDQPKSFYVVSGRIEYASDDSVLSDTGIAEIFIDAGSESRQALDTVYIRKDEYVPGAGPSETVLKSLINNEIQVHANDPTPHPEYDDLPSLKILFENGLI